jgi:hypothetical protein
MKVGCSLTEAQDTISFDCAKSSSMTPPVTLPPRPHITSRTRLTYSDEPRSTKTKVETKIRYCIIGIANNHRHSDKLLLLISSLYAMAERPSDAAVVVEL